MYKLVCIDVDGTLLKKSKSVSERTRYVLKKAENMGVHIVINTGRFLSSAAYYSQLIGAKSPVIALNGSIILEKSTDEIMYKHTMKADILYKLLDVCIKHKVKPTFYSPDKIYSQSRIMNMFLCQQLLTHKLSSSNKVYFKYIGSYRKWPDILEENKNDFIKFEIIDKNKNKISAAREALQKIPHIEVVGSNPYDIEITAENVTKGSAASILADHYNIKREEVICIGDSLNDLSMIEYAGLGVAMGNAEDIIKEKASYITDTNDKDGVAKAVDKFVLEAV